MPSLSHLQRRRTEFLASIDGPVLLMAGSARARNYPDNPFPFRADSNFLFFFATPEQGAAALFDPADRTVTLYLPERTPEGALWHGPVPDFAAMRTQHGVDAVVGVSELAADVKRRAGGRKVRTLAVADERATACATAITGETLDFYRSDRVGDPAVIQALARLRLRKAGDEIDAMRITARVTKEAHESAMRATRPGVKEQEVAGVVEGCFARHGCVPAYNTILSVRGEVLHNHDHGNVCQNGDILLLDAGAEDAATGYCSDVTRSWPVSGRFTSEQAEVYDIVLRAELAAIAAAKPGARYRDVHLLASRVIAEGLVDLGLLHGKPDDLVESGAHALFFPHGVGHLLGLDVHDMETFGDAVAYAPGRTRSAQFGTKYLRLDLDLEPGMAFTIEPGIYFVPAILHHAEFRDRFQGQVDFERAERWLQANDGRGFGGIRIEDDVLCTTSGNEVLTAAIVKERREVEALVGKG
ncbi:MAG TPA: aminopeptidase P family protein [Planctomycetota bacterium]|nr:aminopeptidase P family protein [Planctomycetota bacterium]